MAAMDLEWDEPTTMFCIGYLANPAVEASIEVEIPRSKRAEFEQIYEHLSGRELQLNGDHRPYYVWPVGTDKYGMQGRVYYRNVGLCPDEISSITSSGRSKDGPLRINRTNLVFKLFEYGFTFGRIDIYNILTCVNSRRDFQREFWNGFRNGGAVEDDAILQLRRSIGPPPWFKKINVVRTRPLEAYTYLLQFSEKPIWKVGYTKDLEARLRNINEHLPFEYTGEYWHLKLYETWSDVMQAYEMEQKVLKELSPYRGNRERLSCSFHLVKQAWHAASSTLSEGELH